MNSRLENYKTAWENKEEVMGELQNLYENEEIDFLRDNKDSIEYMSCDDSRKFIAFNDTSEKIAKRMVFDEKICDYINPDKVAEFIYNCIDVNAVSSTKAIALLWNEPVYGENGEVENYESYARQKLMKMLDTFDEYIYEIGICDGETLLGICWVEQSTVIINVDAIVDAAEKEYKDYKEDFFESFENLLVSTICHEFRHAVYEFNEFTELGTKEYPRNGRYEINVEDYGNAEAMKLLHNINTFPYIDAMYSDTLKTMGRELLNKYPEKT